MKSIGINVVKQIKTLAKVNTPLWLISVFGALMTSIPWFLSILATSLMVKISLEYAVSNDNIINVTIIMIIFIIILRLPVILGYAINSWASEKLSALLQVDIIKKWLNRRISENQNFNSGDIMTRLTNDCSDKLSEFYFQGFGLKIVEPLITGVMALVTLYVIDYRFIFVALIFGVISTIVSLSLSKKIDELQRLNQDYNSKISSSFTDCLRNMTSIKSLNIKALKMKDYNKYSAEAADISYRIGKLEAITKGIASFMDFLVLLTCFIMGLTIKDFAITNIVIVIQMQFFINNMLANMGNMWNYLIKISISSERVFELIDTLKIDNNYHNNSILSDNPQVLDIQELSFDYADQRILDKVSIKMNVGKIIVILGETGAGKSTLFDLIQGFISDYSGEIKIDDISLKELSSAEIFNNIKLFEQQPALFNASIRENIQIASDDILRLEQLNELAAKVNLTNVIKSWPNEFDEIIEDDASNLSGGEQQRIALMRLFVVEASILLLDEPTSALDVESEGVICESLVELRKNKLIIINTHRTNIMEIADEVYILEHGHVMIAK